VRGFRWILAWCLSGACCLAQQDEKKLLERVLAKPDMSQINPMNAKKFDSGGFLAKKAAAGSSSFLYKQKTSPGKYENVRSFLGIKNPWIGKKLYESSTASVWSKTLIQNKDSAYPVESIDAGKFHQAERSASRREQPFRTSSYLAQGSAQGRLDQLSEQIDKNMTIEQVREILNKNR
jgi:hypothetical protein